MFRNEIFLISPVAAPYSILWTLCYALLVGSALLQTTLQSSVRHSGPKRNSTGSQDSHCHAKVPSPIEGFCLALSDPSSSSVAWARDCPSLSLSYFTCKLGVLKQRLWHLARGRAGPS